MYAIFDIVNIYIIYIELNHIMHYFAMIGFSQAMPEVGVVRGRCIFSIPSWVDGTCDGNSRLDVNLLPSVKNCSKNQVNFLE